MQVQELFANEKTTDCYEKKYRRKNKANVEGLHHGNHYSTAHDLMKLLQYGMKNPTFKEIFSAKQYGVQKNKFTSSRVFILKHTV